jgi:hypothetical protein
MSASKAKGTAAETAVVRFLQANGYPHAERRALAGNQDRGDVAGIPGLVIEVKNAATITLSAWLKEANAEARRDELPVIWHKHRGYSSPGEWYVTMDGWAFLALLERWTDA